jgi:hypothetical protein
MSRYGIRNYSDMPKNDNNKSFQDIIKDSSDAAMQTMNRNKMIQDMKELYFEMEKRKYNMRGLMIGTGLVTTYFSYGLITDWFTDQAADVTTKYLENPKFKRDIIAFAEETISELTKSERVQQDITKLLEQSVYTLTETEEIQNKLTDLFITIFESKKINDVGSKLSNNIVQDLIHSEEYNEFRRFIAEYMAKEVIKVLNDSNVQNAVGNASWNAFKVWFSGERQ